MQELLLHVDESQLGFTLCVMLFTVCVTTVLLATICGRYLARSNRQQILTQVMLEMHNHGMAVDEIDAILEAAWNQESRGLTAWMRRLIHGNRPALNAQRGV